MTLTPNFRMTSDFVQSQNAYKNKSTASREIYAPSPILENNAIPYSPVKWIDNRAKVYKILFILAILYKSLHMVLGSGGADET